VSVSSSSHHQAIFDQATKLKTAQKLMQVMNIMKKTDKESFVGTLELRHNKWNDFMNERSANPITKETVYIHKRLRRAYRSLKNNLLWLFTWYDYIELTIRNTINAMNGHFADLKNKLRNIMGYL
jgi:CMP-N-acetylneuraminic acid synthetase